MAERNDNISVGITAPAFAGSVLMPTILILKI
jgi:hypothetical protein